MSSIAYGRRLVPHVVDDLALSQPHSVWTRIPRDDAHLDKGYKAYTYRQLANAINVLAHRLDRELGQAGRGETLAYLGPNDARYIVMVLAAVKTGRKALLVSPKNPVNAQISLFEETGCHTVVHAESSADTIQPWFAQRSLKSISLGPSDEFFESPESPQYAYHRTFEEGRFDAFVVLHTSGSTGVPKSITVRAGSIAIMDAYHDLPDFDHRPNWIKLMAETKESMLLPMPLFHAAGLYSAILSTMNGSAIDFPPPTRSVSKDVILESLKVLQSESTFLAPSLLEEMGADPMAVSQLAGLKLVVTGGGSISSGTGDALIRSGVKLFNAIGSTEHTPYSLFKQDPQDWAYFCFQDDISGFQWRPVGDDIYELVIVRKDKDPGLQSCFYTFPDLQEWSTRDLYRKHPTRPNNWMYYGRADNIIVLSNGEKLNPVSIEDAVIHHPMVKGVLVVGQKRFQPALLVEPMNQVDDVSKFLDEIWPNIAKANKTTVRHGRIQRSHVAVLPPERALPRAGKGTIQRGRAEIELKDVIDRQYESAEKIDTSPPTDLDLSTVETMVAFVQQVISSQLDDGTLAADEDFFAAGFDSLQILTIARQLKGRLGSLFGEARIGAISARAVYLNPSSRLLGSYLWEQLHQTPDDQASSKVESVEAMVERYTKDLPSKETLISAPVSAASDLKVILTGSTGSMGSYILDMLNRNPAVSKIFALNRGVDTHARQKVSSSSRGLMTTYPKTEFFTADLSQPRLGLDPEVYRTLVNETSAILHNQWRVDFNLTLASFIPHVSGTRNLIDLAMESPNRPRIVFVSSIAEVKTEAPSVPEHPLPEDTVSPEEGYGASKLTASRILQSSPVPTAIVRVGQVAGPIDIPEKGSWNAHEWFPSLVASSKYMGVIPRQIGKHMDKISWAPVERLATLLVDILVSGETGYFNGVSPRSASYERDVLPVLQKELAVDTVEWDEWVERLEQSAKEVNQLGRNPGVKLLDFYQALGHSTNSMDLIWKTERSQRVSETWRTLEAVQPEWLQIWLKQWNF